MIHVAHVTASPCPDKDLPAACIGYALSRQTEYKVERGKEKMGRGGVGGVRRRRDLRDREIDRGDR